jgi:hypothetical protein
MNRVRGRAGIWLALGISAALLSWVADGIAAMESRPGYAGHYYEYLVDGFLQGHTYLSIDPAPGLARLRDPYDPQQNAPYRLSDASLYHGKYYLYYGPTPAVVLMLPWRVLTGRHLPERWAAAVFATLALAGLALLLWEMRARYFPQLSGWALGAILLVAMHASWLPVTLRRPGFWELPHAAALACLWWTLYFLWRCRSGGGRAGWALAVGAALVLLIGSRPTFIFAAGVVAVLAAFSRAAAGPTGTGRRLNWRTVLAVAVPLGLGGGALILYNVLRFGRPGEFGQSYQLLNVNELHLPHFQPSFFAFNLWIYLGSLPEFSPYFPFVKTVLPGGLPPGYVMSEEMHGAFFALPVQFAGWIALVWAWRRRRKPEFGPLQVTLMAGVATSLCAAVVLFSWAGAASRYLTELTGGWTLATAIGLMVLFTPPDSSEGASSGGSSRPILRAFAILAAVWTVGYVWLASFEHGGLFRYTNPVAYGRMARALDYPSLWAARSEGVVFGPAELTVALGPYRGPETTVLLSSGRLGMMNRLVLRRMDPDHVGLSLQENETVVAEASRMEAKGGTLRVRIEAPWLYPPAQHPYWDRYADPLERTDRQTRFSVGASNQGAVAYSDFSFDATAFEPSIPSPDQGAEQVQSIRRLSKAAP